MTRHCPSPKLTDPSKASNPWEQDQFDREKLANNLLETIKTYQMPLTISINGIPQFNFQHLFDLFAVALQMHDPESFRKIFYARQRDYDANWKAFREDHKFEHIFWNQPLPINLISQKQSLMTLYTHEAITANSSRKSSLISGARASASEKKSLYLKSRNNSLSNEERKIFAILEDPSDDTKIDKDRWLEKIHFAAHSFDII